MSWQPEIDELHQRAALAKAMGGPKRVERQHQAGRLTVRERIGRLVDSESFREIGSIAGKAEYGPDNRMTSFLPANCVFGTGQIGARPVVVCGDDFTVRGGSADAAIWEKMRMAEAMALQYRMPLVRMLEGSGGGGSVRSLEKSGRANLPGGPGGQSGGLHLCAATMSEVPVVGLGLGSVAGLGAARLCVSHYSVMVKNISAVFVAGPPVVERIGEKVTKQELGGAEIQTASGTVDHATDTEEEAFACARKFLSYLPSSVWDLPPRTVPEDDPNRRDESLLSIIPRDLRKVYNTRKLIQSVVDTGSFFEMSRLFGRSIVTGFARLDGWSVAVMAGDPCFFGGTWTAATAQKIVRFIDLAESFHLPVVHFVDCPGFHVGLAAERAGTMRQAVKAVSAINQSTVPWCSMIVRNVFGVGGGAHQPQTHHGFRYAWPSARWGSLPFEGGIEAAYRTELSEASDPKAKLAEIEEALERLRSPFRTAESFWIEEMIDPRDTRKLICEFANRAAPLRIPKSTRWPIRP